MFRRRKPRVEFPRYPRRWPWTVVWALGLAFAATTLLALGFLVAQPPPAERAGPLDELLTTARRTGPAIALAVGSLTAIAVCFRRLWLDWLAVRPGRINVETFSAGSVLDDADLAQLTLRFRHRLAELHLNAPASVPGGLVDGDFLDVLGASGVDSRNWLGSALALLRASKPRHAWQVRGVLVQRKQQPSFGLTVQVVRLPDTGHPPDTIWGTSWDDVIRRSADRATAAILPRTMRCGKQWAAWRRYRMPGDLLEAYEDAAEFEAARRYDEALDAYYKACAHDPMNMGLRLRIGQLQERLGLYLDALATYQGMLTVGDERAVPRRTRERGAARRERRRALVAARYRKVILLGGSELAEQWRKNTIRGATPSKRDRRRQLLRERLRARLQADLEEIAELHPTLPFGTALSLRQRARGESGRPRRGSLDPDAALSEPPRLADPRARPARVTAQEKRTLYQLRELFALLALRELRRLRGELRFHVFDKRILLTPDSVELTARCIEVRLERLQYVLAGGRSDRWPPDPLFLSAQVGSLERVRRFYRWHEHYNAACLFSLPLMADEIRDDSSPKGRRRRDDLAALAVDRLASATAHADSAYIAGRRDWLLSEDPDLDGLRTHQFFKDFEAMNFPAAGATPMRPQHVKRLESSWYVKDLLIAASECWEKAWHTRGQELDRHADIHQLLTWWDDECEAWSLVRAVALNNRHWPTRVKLLHRLQAQADAYRFDPPRVPFPQYAQRVLKRDELGTNPREAADRIADTTEERLAAIGKAVRDKEAAQSAGAAIAHIDRWQNTLRRLDAQGREPRLFLLALLCDHHAALWQLLRQAIRANPEEAIDARQAFRHQMEQAERVWSSAATWWRAPRLVWAAANRGVGNGGRPTATPVA